MRERGGGRGEGGEGKEGEYVNRAQVHIHGEAHGSLVCQYGMSKQPITTLSGQRWHAMG